MRQFFGCYNQRTLFWRHSLVLVHFLLLECSTQKWLNILLTSYSDFNKPTSNCKSLGWVWDASDFCLCMEECRIRHLSRWHWTWQSVTWRDAWHASWAPSQCHIPPILIFWIITRHCLSHCRCGHKLWLSRCKCVIGLDPPECSWHSLLLAARSWLLS